MRRSEGYNVRKTGPAHLEDGRRGWEPRNEDKGEKVHLPLEPPEGARPCGCPDFGSVRPT